MEQQTGSKLGREYVKAVCRHPAYLTYMPSMSCEMPGWIKHKLKEISDCREKYQQPQICRCHHSAESEKEIKSLLMKVKEESEKASLKLNIQKK